METFTSLHSVFNHNLYSVPTFLESGLYFPICYLGSIFSSNVIPIFGNLCDNIWWVGVDFIMGVHPQTAIR